MIASKYDKQKKLHEPMLIHILVADYQPVHSNST